VKLPIIVVSDDSSVQLFPDVDRAVRPMEAIDVLNGEYRVFDADGLRLVLRASSDDGPIEIREAPGHQPEPATLRQLLRAHLRRVRDVRPALVEIGPDELDALDLPGLVALVATTEHRFRETSVAARLRRFVSAMGRRLADR
jgi:hypothetical protein